MGRTGYVGCVLLVVDVGIPLAEIFTIFRSFKLSRFTLFDRIREIISSLAFKIYLKSERLTMEEFWKRQEMQALDKITNPYDGSRKIEPEDKC